MSDWIGHLKVGFVWQAIALLLISGVYFYLGIIPSIIEICLAGIIILLSPVFPDIDHPSSRITKLFYIVATLSLWMTYIFYTQYILYAVIFVTVVILVPQLIPHRGITHRLWFIILTHVAAAYFTGQYALIVLSFSGMCSHLYADKTF